MFPYIWVQYANPDIVGGNRKRVVRVVLEDGASCPTISENTGLIPMTERALPAAVDNGGFPVTVCSATIDATSQASVSITENTQTRHYGLPGLPDDANNIVVIGDTGCRIASWKVQDCGDVNPTAPRTGWPLNPIAKKIAARKPDAILHMGDYHYRELDPCPAQYAGTCGDTWESWKADWFNPAKPVLSTAPWVMLRGNHENCYRAWRGFALFLSVAPMTDAAPAAGCPEITPSYTLALDMEISLSVVDTANQKQTIAATGLAGCGTFKTGIDDLLSQASAAPATHWLTLHHPVFKWSSQYPITPAAEPCSVSQTAFLARNYIQSAINMNTAKGLSAPGMIFSGHAHMWQWNRPLDADYPLQMIVGHGGTYRDSNSAYDLNGRESIGNTPTSSVYPATKAGAAQQAETGLAPGTTGWTTMDIIYGYQAMRKIRLPGAAGKGVWRIDMYDVHDSLLRVCMQGSDPAAAKVVARSAGQSGKAADLSSTGCIVVAESSQ